MEYNTKYSKEFKLYCVLKYLNGEYIETPPNTKSPTLHPEKALVLAGCLKHKKDQTTN